MIEDNPFILGQSNGGVQSTASFPECFNVAVCRLPVGYGAAVRRAFEEGQLDGYIHEGGLHVDYNDLFELAGPGADTDDPLGGCHIPAAAYVTHPTDDPER